MDLEKISQIGWEKVDTFLRGEADYLKRSFSAQIDFGADWRFEAASDRNAQGLPRCEIRVWLPWVSDERRKEHERGNDVAALKPEEREKIDQLLKAIMTGRNVKLAIRPNRRRLIGSREYFLTVKDCNLQLQVKSNREASKGGCMATDPQLYVFFVPQSNNRCPYEIFVGDRAYYVRCDQHILLNAVITPLPGVSSGVLALLGHELQLPIVDWLTCKARQCYINAVQETVGKVSCSVEVDRLDVDGDSKVQQRIEAIIANASGYGVDVSETLSSLCNACTEFGKGVGKRYSAMHKDRVGS